MLCSKREAPRRDVAEHEDVDAKSFEQRRVVVGRERGGFERGAKTAHRLLVGRFEGPEPDEGEDDPHRVDTRGRVVERGPDVGHLCAQAGERVEVARVPEGALVGCGLLRRATRRVVRASHRPRRGLQSVEGEGPQRVEQREVLVARYGERPIDDRRDEVERVDRQLVSGDRLSSVECERTGEDSEPPEERLLRGIEQVVAPLHRRAQRPLARVARVAVPAEESEAVVEPFEDVRGREDGHPGRGQLDREGSRSTLAQMSVTASVFSRLSAKSGRTARARSPNSRTASGRPRGHRPHDFAVDAERLAARREQPQSGTPAQQRVGRPRTHCDEVLARVEHEQAVLVADPRGHCVERLGQRRDPDRTRELERHHRGVTDAGEPDEPCWTHLLTPASGLERQPRLPTPPSPVRVTARWVAIISSTASTSCSLPMRSFVAAGTRVRGRGCQASAGSWSSTARSHPA